MNLRCIIVDDEPIARKGIEEFVREIGFLTLVGSCNNALQASPLLTEESVDLIFLDIQMPKLSGIDFLKSLQHPPMVIFTTAYPEFALEGYELDVLDYLVKPIKFERFVKACQKALDYKILQAHSGTTPSEEFFFIKCDNRFEKIRYDEVLYAEAMQNYSVIHVPGRKYIAYLTFSGLEARLPPSEFLKVHKSFIVSVSKVNAIEGNEVVIGPNRIPISRSLKDSVLKRIMDNNLFKR